MRALAVAIAAGLLAASPAAALEPRSAVHVTPPAVPHPWPQGVPVVGQREKPVFELRYGVVRGKRVLLNAQTMQPVYILRP